MCVCTLRRLTRRNDSEGVSGVLCDVRYACADSCLYLVQVQVVSGGRTHSMRPLLLVQTYLAMANLSAAYPSYLFAGSRRTGTGLGTCGTGRRTGSGSEAVRWAVGTARGRRKPAEAGAAVDTRSCAPWWALVLSLQRARDQADPRVVTMFACRDVESVKGSHDDSCGLSSHRVEERRRSRLYAVAEPVQSGKAVGRVLVGCCGAAVAFAKKQKRWAGWSKRRMRMTP